MKMRSLAILAVGLGCACGASQALAEPFSATSDLNSVAFADRHAAVERTVEQRLNTNRRNSVYVYAGASGVEPRTHADPRWTPQNDPSQASSLVNTKLGVGWRRDGMETSFGYQVRQMKDAPMLYGDAPRKDAMLGLVFKLRPNS